MAISYKKDNYKEVNSGLEAAAMRGDIKLVKICLKKGAVINFSDMENNAAIVMAINNHDVLWLFYKRWLFGGFEPELSHVKTMAAKADHMKIVQTCMMWGIVR